MSVQGKTVLWIVLRLLTIILVTLLLAPSLVFADSFSDVTVKNSKHFAAIEYLYAKNVIGGYPDGTFKPEQTINRAEALKMVMLASSTGGEEESTPVVDFPDVSEDDWFYNYVNKGTSSVGVI